MDFDLTDEQRPVREAARDFVDREIVPRARDNDRNASFDLARVTTLYEGTSQIQQLIIGRASTGINALA